MVDNIENIENSIEELITSLYEMIQDSRSVPLSSDKCILERERALDILDEIRAVLPNELKTAQDIVVHRNELLAAGKREADVIKKQAEDYARKLVNNDDITASAKRKANDIIATSEERVRELKRAANEYCESSMKRAEETVAALLDDIRKSRQQFRAISNGRTSDQN